MKKKTKNKKRTYQILTLLFGAAFLCCILWLAAYLIGLKRAEAEMEAVRESYVTQGDSAGESEASYSDAVQTAAPERMQNQEETGSGQEGEPVQEGTGEGGQQTEEMIEDMERRETASAGYTLSDKSVDIASLQEDVNGDIYAWITVPGTVIDYPVLQHPEEMDYYLEYNLDGTKGYPGCIYTQRMNGKEWEDPNTVLYGHNMKNGTMFAGLHKFEDETFFEENRYIYIYTEDNRILVYEIFAAYVSGNEHLLMSYDIYTDTGFQSYLDSISGHTGSGCHFLEDKELTSEDKIITLSTCISGQATKRYLVQGVLVAEEEQP